MLLGAGKELCIVCVPKFDKLDKDAGNFEGPPPTFRATEVGASFAREVLTDIGVAFVTVGMVPPNDLLVTGFDTEGLVNLTVDCFGPRFCFFTGGRYDEKLFSRNCL